MYNNNTEGHHRRFICIVIIGILPAALHNLSYMCVHPTVASYFNTGLDLRSSQNAIKE